MDNARFNCEMNNIENCTFFHGRAEEILSSVINKAVNKEIVAVVDPPRAGLRKYSTFFFGSNILPFLFKIKSLYATGFDSKAIV